MSYTLKGVTTKANDYLYEVMPTAEYDDIEEIPGSKETYQSLIAMNIRGSYYCKNLISQKLVQGKEVSADTATITGPMSAKTGTFTNITCTDITGNLSGNVTGNLQGNVNGNVTGNLQGNVTGDLNGNVTGTVTGDLEGDVVGNVTGNVTGDLQGNVTGNLEGNVKGNVIGNLEGNVEGNLTGDVKGNVEGNVKGDVVGDLEGNVVGNVIGDLQGNVEGNVVGNLTGDVEGNITGDTCTFNTSSLGSVTADTLTVIKDLTVKGASYASAYQATSDLRLKTNLKPLNNAVETISQLGGYTYTLKDEKQRRSGLIAQEVEQVFPEAVRTDSKGYKSIDYNAIIALLVTAINELK